MDRAYVRPVSVLSAQTELLMELGKRVEDAGVHSRLAIGVVLPRIPVVHEYRHSTRVQRNSRGFLFLYDARLFPGQNSVG